MVIKAALLDAPAASGRGVFVRMDELADQAALTACHVPQIEHCDLPPGAYIWVPDEKNLVSGGAFWKKAWVEQAERLAAAKQRSA